MKPARLATLAAACCLGAGVTLAAPEARALCLPGGAPTPCSSFDPATGSFVIRRLTPASLASAQFLQVGVGSTTAGQTLSQIAFSFSDPGNDFNAAGFAVLDASLSTLASPSLTPGSLVNLGSPSGQSDIWIRYQIVAPNTISPGESVRVSLIGNSNGTTAQGFLSSDGSNAYFAETVTNTVPVPGPLPLFGAGAAFACSRRLRRRSLEAGKQAR